MRLLISVLSSHEARTIRGLADMTDVKEPSRGPLGAPDVSTVRAVRAAAGPEAAVSAALGDMDCRRPDTIERAVRLAKAGANLVKVGLTDHPEDRLLAALSALRVSTPPNVMVVAAAYADAPELKYLSPFKLPAIAAMAGVDGMLIDTYRKDGRKLTDFLSQTELASITAEARRLGLGVALAGSLTPDDLEVVAAAGPDWVGFRSAVTVNGRTAQGIDPGKVEWIREMMRRSQPDNECAPAATAAQ